VGENAAVPAAPDDRRVLLFAGGLVLLAGVAVAALLFLATGGTQDTPSASKPLFLGLERELTAKIEEGGPLYFASPFGENGFWLDVEDGRVVALDIVKPGTKDCQVKWRDPRGAYVDCNDQELQAADLDRFTVTVGKLQKDAPSDAVYVNLRVSEPAPIPTGGG
jgi:hypothetical protein